TSYSASALAAPYFVAAALNYKVVSTFYLNRRPFTVAKLFLQFGSSLDGITVEEFHKSTRMWIIAHVTCERDLQPPKPSNGMVGGNLRLRQSEPIFQPNLKDRLNGGDTLYVIGSYERVIALYHLNKPRKTRNTP
ncbi:MAG: hypothetical protein WCS37_19835, partial [Chloroflexota bacterium]